MRLLILFLLAPALVSAYYDGSRVDLLPRLDTFNLPRGLPDGSVLTLWFLHTEDCTDEQYVYIDFYDTEQKSDGDRAQLRIDQDEYNPVKSDTLVNGKWQSLASHIMELSPVYGMHGNWWRVDVIKHDEFHMNVYFLGMWAGVRKFDKSLNNIKIVHFDGCVDYVNIKAHIHYPNNNLAPLSVAQFMDKYNGEPSSDFKLASFPSFPIGAHIEMIAMMRVPSRSERTPMLKFVQYAGVESVFMKIVQAGQYTDHLFIAGPEHYEQGTNCIKYGTENGEMVHLDLKRMSQNVVRLQVLYKLGTEEGVTCDLTLPMDASHGMDGPFDILSHQSALLFHISMMSK